MSKITEQNCIYAAGLFDGEGTVTLSKIHKSNLYRSPTASVTSTSFELVEYLKLTFGGFICNQKVAKEHYKQSWSWRIAHDKAIEFLTLVKPYIKEKKKLARIQLICDNYKKLTLRNGRYTEEQKNSKLIFEQAFFDI